MSRHRLLSLALACLMLGFLWDVSFGAPTLANSNAMSGVGRASRVVVGAATPQQLAPAACGASRLTNLAAVALVGTTPYTLPGSTQTLVLGRNVQSTITGGGGADCIVGGGGLDTLIGGAGSDACLGPAGTTFDTTGSDRCEVTGTH